VAGRFDPESWCRAFAVVERPTDDDRRLLEAALWIGAECRALFEQQDSPFDALSAADAVILGVARLNLEFRMAAIRDDEVRDAIPQDEIVSFDYWSHLRHENDYGQLMSSGDYMESAVDALEPWLYDARRVSGIETSDPDLLAISGAAAKFYTLRGVLKNMFDKALHLGDGLCEGSDTEWEPRDWRLSELMQAWHGRAEANFLTPMIEFREEWQEMTPGERRRVGLRRTAVGARWADRGLSIRVGRREYLSKRLWARDIEQAGLRGGALAAFVDEPMPLASGLSVTLLVDVWAVLTDIARLAAGATRRVAGFDMEVARFVAGDVSPDELQRVLCSALGISSETAAAAIEFLTFGERRSGRDREAQRGYRGLWSAPLVPVPGEDRLLLPQPVFEIGNPSYRVEAWLEKGGIDDNRIGSRSRGDRFEVNYRRALALAIERNPLMRSARVAPDGIDRTDAFPHQVDILFSLGSRLFVGELKFFLTPTDPHHWDRFFRDRLGGAAEQANLRAAALRERPDVVADALGIAVEAASRLSVVPIIVVSQGYGFSLEVDGCRAVDADFLCSYLASPDFRGTAMMNRGRRVAERIVTLYRSELEASDRFAEVMADPWPLRRFLDRMERVPTPYPRPTGGEFTIASSFRGDLTPAQLAGGIEAMVRFAGGRQNRAVSVLFR
jgi:hypothetical protein